MSFKRNFIYSAVIKRVRIEISKKLHLSISEPAWDRHVVKGWPDDIHRIDVSGDVKRTIRRRFTK